jgi:hypothetical protein
MQATGRYWHEAGLLRIAYAAKQALERRRPAIFFSILQHRSKMRFSTLVPGASQIAEGAGLTSGFTSWRVGLPGYRVWKV